MTPSTGSPAAFSILRRSVPGEKSSTRRGRGRDGSSREAGLVQRLLQQVMELLLINHPVDCPVCDQAGECHLQDYSYQYGRGESRFREDKIKQPKKSVGPNVLLYSDRCIMCSTQLGVMDRQLKTCIEFARNRTQFDQPIGLPRQARSRSRGPLPP